MSHTSVAGIQKATKGDEGIISEVTLRQLSELKKAIWRLKGITEYPERWENIDSDQDISSHHAKRQEEEKSLKQGSPAPGPRTVTCPWSVRNRATQQETRETKAIPTLSNPWKICLPWNQPLVPKKPGTASLQASKHVVFKGLGIRMASELSRTSGTLERHRAVSSNFWRERIPSQTSPSR